MDGQIQKYESESESAITGEIKRGFLRTAWQEEMRQEVQRAREETNNLLPDDGMNRLFNILDEIIRRI